MIALGYVALCNVEQTVPLGRQKNHAQAALSGQHGQDEGFNHRRLSSIYATVDMEVCSVHTLGARLKN